MERRVRVGGERVARAAVVAEDDAELDLREGGAVGSRQS